MQGPSVLIVEDEAIVALDLKIQLQKLKYEVVGVAESGERAIDGGFADMAGNAVMAAMVAKTDGGNCHRFFEARMNTESRERTEWLDHLRMAVERGELELYYQPKVHALSGQIAGAEALLRWNHPKRGMVSPTVFIPLRNGSA